MSETHNQMLALSQEEKNQYDLNMALLNSIEDNEIEKAIKFIELGADVNRSASPNSNTPMVAAIYDCNPNMINMLIDKGANIHLQFLRPELIEPSISFNALMIAIEALDIDMVKMMIEKGSRLEEKDNEGKTAIMFAIDQNNVEIFQYLLDQGSSLDVVNNQNETVMDMIKYHGNPEMMSVLEDFLLRQTVSSTSSIVNDHPTPSNQRLRI